MKNQSIRTKLVKRQLHQPITEQGKIWHQFSRQPQTNLHSIKKEIHFKIDCSVASKVHGSGGKNVKL